MTKPFLHDGKPVNIRPSSPDTSPLYFCQCRECVHEWGVALDFAESHDVQSGCWLNATMYHRHKKEETLRRELDHANLDENAQPIDEVLLPNSPGPRYLPSSLHRTTTHAANAGPTIQSQHPPITELDVLRSKIDLRVHSLSLRGPLQFGGHPTVDGAYVRRGEDTLLDVNSGPHMLEPRDPRNQSLLTFENDLTMLMKEALAIETLSIGDIAEERDAIVQRIIRELDRVDDFKEKEWERQRKLEGDNNEDSDTYVNTDAYFSAPHASWDPMLLSAYLTVLLMFLVCGLPRRAASLLLVCLRSMVRFSDSRSTMAPLLQDIPRDPRTVIGSFELEPRTRSYVCCPACFALYDTSPLPPVCTHQPTPASRPCNTKLWKTRIIRGNHTQYPIRRYLHQDLKQWIARFVSRPGVEDFLDSAASRPREGADIEDIWHASTFRQFKGPDGEPFFSSTTQEGRYVFSLGVDGFNPFQNKVAKQNVTVTGMYMVCLNLPPDLRYLPENMYLVGIIPGPTKPSTDQINHFLKLLVDDLLPFWEPGVTFSRTAKYPDGRVIRIALIPIVCDLPAAKQVAGFGGVSSKYFCSYCLLPRWDIDNLDRSQWPPRDLATHYEHASAYRDAATLEERHSLFDQFGARWTELLRLPYWDPISFTVVESMHILYLRILRHHCRIAWRMNVDLEDGEAASGEGTKSIARPLDEAMQKGVEALATGTFGALDACHKPVLYHLCQDRSLRRANTKRALIKTLLNWKANQSMEDKPPKPVIPPRPLRKTPLTDVESARLLLEDTAAVSNLSLLRFTKPILASLCDAKGRRRSGNKNDLVGRLLDWRLSQNLPNAQSAIESGSSTMKEVRNNQRTAEEYLSSTLQVDADILMSYTRNVLVALCSERHLNIVGQKKVLVQRLIKWQAEHNGSDHGAHPGDSSHDAPSIQHPGQASDTDDGQVNRVVLGQSLVTEIQKDMLRTELPTWVSKAPKGLGSAAQGKLSADQWRAACTVNMTITLIRLWGGKNGEAKAMLDNFMDLVTAVELGCMFIISPRQDSIYDFYMMRYLENFKELYKTLSLVPSHHIALHLGEFLSSFGPVHAWRAFAFERYNYLLQRENNNGKFGEIEQTMMNHTCRVANLRTLIQEESIRDTVAEMVDAYGHFAGEDRRGTRIRDVLQWEKTVTTQGQTSSASKEVILEEKIYYALLQLIDATEQHRYVAEGKPRSSGQLFLRRKVLLSNRILIRGVSYRPSDFSHCDSNILFQRALALEPEAGRIVKIFIHHRYASSNSKIEETFLAVQPLIPLSDADVSHDHFRQYPVAGGFLCYNQYRSDYCIIKPSEVTCHYAKTPLRVGGIGQPCVHVLPLDRLMKIAEPPAPDEVHNEQGVNTEEH